MLVALLGMVAWCDLYGASVRAVSIRTIGTTVFLGLKSVTRNPPLTLKP